MREGILSSTVVRIMVLAALPVVFSLFGCSVTVDPTSSLNPNAPGSEVDAQSAPATPASGGTARSAPATPASGGSVASGGTARSAPATPASGGSAQSAPATPASGIAKSAPAGPESGTAQSAPKEDPNAEPPDPKGDPNAEPPDPKEDPNAEPPAPVEEDPNEPKPCAGNPYDLTCGLNTAGADLFNGKLPAFDDGAVIDIPPEPGVPDL